MVPQTGGTFVYRSFHSSKKCRSDEPGVYEIEASPINSCTATSSSSSQQYQCKLGRGHAHKGVSAYTVTKNTYNNAYCAGRAASSVVSEHDSNCVPDDNEGVTGQYQQTSCGALPYAIAASQGSGSDRLVVTSFDNPSCSSPALSVTRVTLLGKCIAVYGDDKNAVSFRRIVTYLGRSRRNGGIKLSVQRFNADDKRCTSAPILTETISYADPQNTNGTAAPCQADPLYSYTRQKYVKSFKAIVPSKINYFVQKTFADSTCSTPPLFVEVEYWGECLIKTDGQTLTSTSYRGSIADGINRVMTEYAGRTCSGPPTATSSEPLSVRLDGRALNTCFQDSETDFYKMASVQSTLPQMTGQIFSFYGSQSDCLAGTNPTAVQAWPVTAGCSYVSLPGMAPGYVKILGCDPDSGPQAQFFATDSTCTTGGVSWLNPFMNPPSKPSYHSTCQNVQEDDAHDNIHYWSVNSCSIPSFAPTAQPTPLVSQSPTIAQQIFSANEATTWLDAETSGAGTGGLQTSVIASPGIVYVFPAITGTPTHTAFTMLRCVGPDVCSPVVLDVTRATGEGFVIDAVAEFLYDGGSTILYVAWGNVEFSETYLASEVLRCEIKKSTGSCSTIITSSDFGHIKGIRIDAANNLYLGDVGSDSGVSATLYKCKLSSLRGAWRCVEALVHDEVNSLFGTDGACLPVGMSIASDGSAAFLACYSPIEDSTYTLLKCSLSAAATSTRCALFGPTLSVQPYAVAVDLTGQVYYSTVDGSTGVCPASGTESLCETFPVTLVGDEADDYITSIRAGQAELIVHQSKTAAIVHFGKASVIQTPPPITSLWVAASD